MPFTLTLPKLSPTMEEGTIVKWNKREGDFVEVGDVVLEVATDKATIEYQAIDEGWLRKILIKEGKEARVNQPIAILTSEKKESIEKYVPQGVGDWEKNNLQEIVIEETASSHVPVESKPIKRPLTAVQFQVEPPLENYVFEYPRESLEKKVLASPLAKKLAKEKGLDLSTVKGTGPGQRIVAEDLDKAQVVGKSFGSRIVPNIAPGSYEEKPLSQMRKALGQRLQDAKGTIPHFYVTQVIDAEPLGVMREQLKSQEIKLTINDFIIKACALALKQHPEINTGFHSVNSSIIQFQTVDIAVAVNVASGLITPIIRHADYKNLGEISLEMRLLAQKAREGKLESHEYKGGSFSITNLGMHGITEFQAILNPPQAAILAVGGIQEVPVIRNGTVVPGKTMHLTLSVDHRVIDGVAAALFLQSLKKLLENPAILLI